MNGYQRENTTYKDNNRRSRDKLADCTVPVVIGDSVGTTDYFRLKRGAVLLKDMVTEIGALGRLLTLDS